MMKQKLLTAALIVVTSLLGCISNNSIDRQIAQCPEYFQNNVGTAKILPFWYAFFNLTGGPTGWCDRDTGNYYLSPLASEYVVLHEAFHSFDVLTYRDRQDEWQRFTQDFGIATPNPLVYFACMLIPFVQDVPVPGYVRLYGLSNGAEDSADCFAYWVRSGQSKDIELQLKLLIIKKYTTGQYNGM